VEEKRLYIMLHKPRGFVTTLSDEKGRPNAAQLVADCGTRVYPIGRLDMDSEGLLLFTNDGEFANGLAHPSHEVEKTYRVFVTGDSPEAIERVKQPILLDGYRIKPPRVFAEAPGRLRITIHEGRNRQVRRMCDAAGMHVTRLIRIGEGKLRLGDLPRGKWRHLTEEEMKLL
jgi:23S rRNA pseudouridine2605 synthase